MTSPLERLRAIAQNISPSNEINDINEITPHPEPTAGLISLNSFLSSPGTSAKRGAVGNAASAAPGDAEQPEVASVVELDDRAAITEYGAGVPRRWAEGYAALSTMPRPTGFAPERWQRIVDAVGVFLDRWAAEAIRCGWSDLDVFGVDPDRPDARFDAMGLVLLLDRREIVSIDERGVDLITSPDHVHQRYYRRPRPVGTVLLWDSVVAKRGRDAG
jgi:hypothetical protein